MGVRAGVLALQGDVGPHLRCLERLGHAARRVRGAADLDGLTHLVLPGGESTALWRLMRLFGLWEPVRELHRARVLALFGTCAGAILLGRDTGEEPPRLGLFDAELERNAYGPQVCSRVAALALPGLGIDEHACVFIRAPRFTRVGRGASVLARDGRDPILVAAPGLLAATFHPELTGDARVHEHFLELRGELAWRSTKRPRARA